MEKYGFIYVWFDKKHKKFYVGRHWGHIDDGYVCSSNNMRMNFKYRPDDFKRRIVSFAPTKETLVIEEQRWLDMIKSSELNNKYYNKTKKATTPSTLGYNHSKETKNKISKANKGKTHTKETKKKLKIAQTGKKLSEETKKKISENHNRNYSDPVWIEKNKIALDKMNNDPTIKQKRNATVKQKLKNGTFVPSCGMKGKNHSEESKLKMKESRLKYLNMQKL